MPPEIRRATPADAACITRHRHQMFADNRFATEERLIDLDAEFAPWVHAALTNGTYIGLLMEEDGKVIAGAGIYLMPFPPHFRHLEPRRAYLLNVYTAPEARGRGLARQLTEAAIAESRAQGCTVLTLHASPQGRPIYEKLGFAPTSEMMLTLT